MAAPASDGSGESPSLYASLRGFWGVVAAIFYTRLDLVTAELEDEATRAIRLVVSGLLSLLLLHTAFFFAMLFVLAAFWDTQYRLLTIGLIFGVYLIGGLISFAIARNLIVSRPRFLSQTLSELRRDVEGLKSTVAPKKENAS